MANVSFTRDEVILTLDVLYFSGAESLSPRSPEIIALSQLLNELPIHPLEERPANFRNCTGISHQLNHFKNGYSDKEGAWNVGAMFFRVDSEFKDRLIELHEVAEAIRQNRSYFSSISFGCEEETEQFSEGALLGHMHRVIEQRDGRRYQLAERCSICQLDPSIVYSSGVSVLRNHLIVSPSKLDFIKKYAEADFITVCPNCHAALHSHRPWLSKNNCEDILR